MTEWTMTVVGEPIPWTAPKKDGDTFYQSRPELTEWENTVEVEAKAQLPGLQFAGAVEITLIFYRTPPTSWPKWKKEFAMEGERLIEEKPDFDNLAKAVCDGLENAGLFADDGQIARAVIEKRWRRPEDSPRVEITMVGHPRYPKTKAEMEKWKNKGLIE